MDASQITINLWPAGSLPSSSAVNIVAADEEQPTAPGEADPDVPATEVPWTFANAFQDVSSEESRNSFVKQFGRFTLHDDDHGRADRV
jgi:hypothetical protein